METLLFTAIGSTLLMVVSLIYLSGLNTRTMIDAQQRLLYVDEFIHATFSSRFYSSTEITEPLSGTGASFSFYDPITASTIRFSRSETNLVMTIGSGQPILLNSLGVRVTNFQAIRLVSPSNAVRIIMTYEVDTVNQRTISFDNAFTLMGYEE